MSAKIIDGKAISQQIKDELKEKTAALKEKGIEVTLAVILVGEDPASQVYVRNKKRACEYIGYNSLSYELPAETSQEELLKLIDELNGSINWVDDEEKVFVKPLFGIDTLFGEESVIRESLFEIVLDDLVSGFVRFGDRRVIGFRFHFESGMINLKDLLFR